MSNDKSAAPVAEGEIIAGKYCVARTLGVGGMGVVVAATHIDLNQRVALKFLLPQALLHPDLVARFAREARAAAQIQSEHVARVIDVGTLDTGAPYMVMEYLDGQDLHEVLTNSGPFDAQTAVGWVLQACEAIAEAHSLGIVHRDLKPANLFLANKPNGTAIVKVLDFGISKSTATDEQKELTKTGAMMGSPSYMAPEQFRGAKQVDARADQWALGVILYELIAGIKPFCADSMAELMWVILDQTHVPIRTLCPEVAPGLDAIIQRCLEKGPADRFLNVAELAMALAQFGPTWGVALAQRAAHVLGTGIALSNTEAPPPALDVSMDETAPEAPRVAHESPAEGAATNSPWSQSSPPVPAPPPRAGTKRSPLLIPVVVATLVGGAALAAFAMKPQAGTSEVSAPTLPPSTLSATPSNEIASPPMSAVPVPPAVVAPTATPEPPPTLSTQSAPLPAPSAEPHAKAIRAKAAPVPTTSKTPTASPPAPSSAPPQCKTVPYYDSDGTTHFKQDCR